MRKVAFFSTVILLLSLAPQSYAHGSWGGGGGWHGGGCCGGWGGRGGVFIGYGGFGYPGYPYDPYAYAPYPYPYPPAYPYYPPSPASPAAYSGTVTPSAPSAASAADPATVRAIQAELQRQGYSVGSVDGRIGPRTRAAIRQYEQQNGLPADGSPSRSLLDHMRSHSTG